MGKPPARFRRAYGRSVALATMTAMSDKRKHPHFDDRGAHDWHVDWSEAAAKAKAENKRIFVEIGREL